MSDDLRLNPSDLSGDDYEEISSEEVDRVVESLESLMASVDSENIRAILEDATNNGLLPRLRRRSGRGPRRSGLIALPAEPATNLSRNLFA